MRARGSASRAATAGVVARMRGVVVVPEVVPGRVALAEHAEVEVPGLSLEQLEREPPLGVDAGEQPLGQLRVLVGGADRSLAGELVVGREVADGEGVDPEHRVRAVALDDLGGELGRRAAEAEVAVVTAPLGDLDPVQPPLRATVRDVDRRDPQAGVRQRMPERPSGELVGGPHSSLVGGGIDLEPAVVADLRRRAPGHQRRPQGADEEAVGIARLGLGAGLEQLGDRRQAAGRRQLARQRRVERVESEHDDPRVRAHPPSLLAFARSTIRGRSRRICSLSSVSRSPASV